MFCQKGAILSPRDFLKDRMFHIFSFPTLFNRHRNVTWKHRIKEGLLGRKNPQKWERGIGGPTISIFRNQVSFIPSNVPKIQTDKKSKSNPKTKNYFEVGYEFLNNILSVELLILC